MTETDDNGGRILQRIFRLGQSRGQAGITAAEAAKAMNASVDNCAQRLRWLEETGRATSVTVREGRRHRRWFITTESWEVSLRKWEAKKREIRAEQVAKSNAAVARGGAIEAPSLAARVEYRVVDGRRVKCTVAATPVDKRFAVNPADGPFGRMAPGCYLPGETWASRVVGSRV